MTIPEHIKTQARALMFSGYASERVSQMLRDEFGDDAPNARTLRRWREERPEMSIEEQALVRDNNTRLALRFDALIDRKLDQIEQDVSKVRLPELIMGSGVFRDKDRHAATMNVRADKVQFNFLVQQEANRLRQEIRDLERSEIESEGG